MNNERAQFLFEHPPFNLIPFDEVVQMTRELKEQQLPPEYTILEYNGAPSEYLYILRRGSADVLRKNEQGVMTQVDILDEGEAFGHLSLISHQPPNATVRTREDVTVYMLPPAYFHQLREKYPAFGRLFEAASFQRLYQIFQTHETGTHPEFRMTLEDILSHPLVFVTPETTVLDVARLMRLNQVDCIFIDVLPLGLITERDLRNRVMAEGLSYDTPVQRVMTSPLVTLPSDSLIFEGLTLMMQHHIRHLPVTKYNEVIGVITHTDILRQQSHSPIFLPRQLTRARGIADFKTYTQHVRNMVGTLLKTDTRTQDIGRVVAIAHDALLERMLSDAEKEVGPPPCPYAWLVLGSEGRYEQTLHTDQDNAIVYANDAPDDADDYFAALAERIVDQLVICGFPRCPGDIMATNPRWRQPLRVWQQYFDDWIHIPDEDALMRVGIFFDYRQVYGTLNVEAGLRPVIQQASTNGLFLRRLSKGALRQSPPLGFFRNLVVEHDGEGRDVIDLKVRGTALVVDIARLFALAAGCSETNTITRLRVAAQHSDLSEQGAEELAAAFESISRLRMRHHLSQIDRGEATTNLVPLSLLSQLERRELKEALRTVGGIQKSVSSLFGTAFVG